MGGWWGLVLVSCHPGPVLVWPTGTTGSQWFVSTVLLDLETEISRCSPGPAAPPTASISPEAERDEDRHSVGFLLFSVTQDPTGRFRRGVHLTEHSLEWRPTGSIQGIRIPSVNNRD